MENMGAGRRGIGSPDGVFNQDFWYRFRGKLSYPIQPIRVKGIRRGVEAW